jgi:hypothetical protein
VVRPPFDPGRQPGDMLEAIDLATALESLR